ncbi:MAG: hypothetical protein GY757_51835, partial [bacterium]|nr:hypothetical protein [bacterium]
MDKPDPLTVHFNFSGEVDIHNELVITFSDDMIPLGGERDGKEIFFLTPQVKGKYHWRDAKTLVLKPEQALAYSTRYKAIVKGGISSLNNKRLKKEHPIIFTTPTPRPRRLEAGDTTQYTRHNVTITKIPVDKRIRLDFNQPVTKKEVANKILVTKRNSKTAIKVSCTQFSEKSIRLKFPKPLERETDYRVLFKKGFTGSEGNTGTKKEYFFYLSTLKTFKVDSFPLTIRKNIKKIPVSFSYKLKEVTKKHISVYILREGKPKTPCQFGLTVKNSNLSIYPTEPIPDGQHLEVQISKNLKSIRNETLKKDTRFTIKICSLLPEIFPVLEKEKPELYFNGIKNIKFSLLKYKDTVLDLLTESRFQTIAEGRKILLDKKHIEKEYTFQHQTGKGEAVRFPLDIKKLETKTGAPDQSPIQQGLYAFKIDSLEVRNTCNKKRFVYFIKALYSGTFTWMPTKVQGMYHPQYYGRAMIKKIK